MRELVRNKHVSDKGTNSQLVAVVPIETQRILADRLGGDRFSRCFEHWELAGFAVRIFAGPAAGSCALLVA